MLSQSRKAFSLVSSIQRHGLKFGVSACRVLSTVPGAVENKFDTTFFYENNFLEKELKGINEARVGGLVELDQEDIAKYFPEGFAGELKDEFEFSDSNTMMIREPAKLVCRILDEYIAGDGKSVCTLNVTKSVSSAVTVKGLTDRKEWPSSLLSVKHFGHELVEMTDREEFVVSSGDGSVVERCLTNLNKISNELPRRIMLTGPRGVGKSVALNQAVLHARKSKWLVLFVPGGWDQVQSGAYVEPLPHLTENGKQLYDNAQMSAEVLRNFWRAHREELESLPLTNQGVMEKYATGLLEFDEAYAQALTMPGREGLDFMGLRAVLGDAGMHDPEDDDKDRDIVRGYEYVHPPVASTLADLVRFGVVFRQFSGQVFMDLMAELREVDKYPVLVAVDQYNTWEVPSAFEFADKKVHSREIVVPHSLNIIRRTGEDVKKVMGQELTLKRGIMICATSHRHIEGKKITFEGSDASVPLNIRVPNYNQVEFLSAVTNYACHDIIYRGVTQQELVTFRMHTGSNPRLARKETVPFFFPRGVAKDLRKYSNNSDYGDGLEDEMYEKDEYPEDLQEGFNIFEEQEQQGGRGAEDEAEELFEDDEEEFLQETFRDRRGF